MSEEVLAYIATYRLSKKDSLETRKRFRNKKTVAFAVRVFHQSQITAAHGWVKGTQPVFAQVTALDCIMRALEEAGVQSRLKLILRTEYLRQRLDMAHARLLKKQKGQELEPMKEDTELWESTAKRWEAFHGGLRPDMNPQESHILVCMEKELRELFYDEPSPLEGKASCTPDITLT